MPIVELPLIIPLISHRLSANIYRMQLRDRSIKVRLGRLVIVVVIVVNMIMSDYTEYVMNKFGELIEWFSTVIMTLTLF